MRMFFPYRGIDKGRSTNRQTPEVSPNMNNMRLFDTLDTRARGGQRPGLEKWGAGTQIGGSEQPVVALCIVSAVV